MRAPALSVLVLCAAAVTPGCRGRSPTAARTITVGIQQEPDSLFAPYREMLAAEEVLRAGGLTLVVNDDRWRVLPSAAEAVPTVENGLLTLQPDGRMVARWRIRAGQRWADGTPVTADDFALHQALLRDPSQEIADRSHVGMLESVEVTGPDRLGFTVTWKGPYAYHAAYRTFEALPRHVVEKRWKDSGSALKQDPFGMAPLLAGPFVFGRWARGQHVSLVRNPHAPAWAAPAVDRLVWRIIPSTAGLEAALLSGEVDALSPVGLLLDQALELQRRHGDRFDFHFTQSLNWEHVDFNLDDPWLRDVRLRRAIISALDRETMLRTLFGGRTAVAHGYNPPGRYDHLADVRKWPHDPALAARLLDELGFHPGDDGIRTRDGKRLSLTLTTTAGQSTRERIAQVMAADLRKVGIELVVEAVPARVMFGELTRRRKFKHLAMYAWAFEPVKGPENFFACAAIPSAGNAWQGQNYGGWCHKEASRDMERASRELDEHTRAEILRGVQRIWAEELPAIPLYFRTEASVTRKGFRNWRPTGTLTPVTWNAREWEIR